MKPHDKPFLSHLTDVKKNALRAMHLYEPSHDDLVKRAQWISEMVVLKALTELYETGVWDDKLYIGDPSDRLRRHRYLGEKETLETPDYAIRMIQGKVMESMALVKDWEKADEAPAQSQCLAAFAKKIEERIGSDPSAVLPEIYRLSEQLLSEKNHANDVSTRLTTSQLFKTLSSSEQPKKPALSLA